MDAARTTLTLLSQIKLPRSQLDGIVLHGDHLFATLHSADEGPIIAVLDVSTRSSLHLLRKVPLQNGFPHGIDIRSGWLAYTSYSSSSLVILPLQYILKDGPVIDDALGSFASSACNWATCSCPVKENVVPWQAQGVFREKINTTFWDDLL